MSKYDAEIVSAQQSIAGQQEKIRRLREVILKVERKGEQIGTLSIRQIDLPYDFWQGKSDSVMREVLQRRFQFWNNQNVVVSEVVREIQAEINRTQTQVSDYQADIRYYSNLKRLEEEVSV
ncbi:hypothetical protein HCB28_00255 [Listeria sp. FSL L7-0253]|uniref:hypothetical protein n=1 Tax=Listeria cossartiae TaxID=2838249 RepID=UPI001624B514|nr:hypothetical protein [Listeria cossartiae]MBC2184603.1 hypothetical protein [Listeria cossartiae subsp. cossartiae]